MQIELKAEIGGFIVPSALPCRVQDSGNEILQSLKALPPDILSALCEEFRAEVFAQAGVSDPREAEPSPGVSDPRELRRRFKELDAAVAFLVQEPAEGLAQYGKALAALDRAIP